MDIGVVIKRFKSEGSVPQEDDDTKTPWWNSFANCLCILFYFMTQWKKKYFLSSRGRGRGQVEILRGSCVHHHVH